MKEWRIRVARQAAARRGELGLTQQELAEHAGVDLKTIYNLESGERWPQAKTRGKIEKALGWASGKMEEIRLQQPGAQDDIAKEVLDVQAAEGLVMITVPKGLSEVERDELRRWGERMARYMAEREGGRPDRNT